MEGQPGADTPGETRPRSADGDKMAVHSCTRYNKLAFPHDPPGYRPLGDALKQRHGTWAASPQAIAT